MNSKAPVGRPVPYASDAVAKQAAATDVLRRSIDSLARPRLEALRQRFR